MDTWARMTENDTTPYSELPTRLENALQELAGR